MLHIEIKSDVQIRNKQGQHLIENLNLTCNWLDFELQMHGMLHIVSKKEISITSHDPLWCSIEWFELIYVYY